MRRRALVLALLPFLAALAVHAAPPDPIAPLARPSILLARAVATDSGRAELATSVTPVAGGALITGWTTSGDGPPDGLLVRVDDDGEVVWRRRYGAAGMDLLWAVHDDGAGGWVGVGFTAGRGAGSLDGWLIGIGADGALRWEKTVGAAGEDRLTQIHPTRDGWIAVGQTAGRGAGGTDALVVKLDRAGNEVASWTWGGSGHERAFGIQPLDDGGCVIAGMAGGAELEAHDQFDAFVTRLGPDGRERWSHRARRPGFQVAHDVRRAADGFVVYGYGHVDAKRGIDGFALRVREDGRVAFEKTFGGATYDRANHAEIFADGSSAVVGYTQRPGAVDEENLWDLVVYALDREGDARWSARFGGEGIEFGRGIAGTPENLWVVGHTTTGRSASAIQVVRLDVSPVLGGAATR